MMVLFKGYTIEIKVDGKVLKEYQPPDGEEAEFINDGLPTVVRYVQAEKEKAFEIAYQIPATTLWPLPKKHVTLHADGQFLQGKSRTRTKRRIVDTLDGRHYMHDGQPVKRRFEFTSLETTEEQISENQSREQYKDIGEIRVTLSDATTKASTKSQNRSEQSDYKVPEKALKGREIGARARLGAAVPSAPFRRYHIVKEQKLVEYIFKYRSKKGLQALDILPMSPEPEPEPTQPDVNTMTEAQVRDYARTLQSQLIPPVPVKTEPSISNALKRYHVDDEDEECSFVSTKKTRTQYIPGEEIDLT